MSAAVDLEIVENWLLTRYAAATCIKHRIPAEPISHQFSLSFVKEEWYPETAVSMRTQRHYEIRYWHHDPEEVLKVMGEIAEAWHANRFIHGNNESQALRLISFGYSPIQGTANEWYGCLGTLIVEGRTQQVHEPVTKMATIKTAFQ